MGTAQPAQTTETIIPDTLTEFFEVFGDAVKKKVASKFRALFDPQSPSKEDREIIDSLYRLLREPKKGQVAPVVSTIKGLEKLGDIVIVGEMGVGKTYMGAAASTFLPERSRTIVLCPGTLVHKWIREIKKTVPNAICHNLNKRGLNKLKELDNNPKPRGREFWIVGKEQAKLHYTRKPAFSFRDKRPVCPSCGTWLEEIPNAKTKKPACEECGSALWEADRNGFRRYAKSEYIKKHLPKGTFDLLICDEFHQYKSGSSAQGQAFANIASKATYTLSLTGTLMGGYSTNLFHLLWRIAARTMKRIASYRRPMDFAQKYGVIDRIEKTLEEATSSSIGRNKKSVRVAERPGISPLILTDLLLERCIFVSLADVADELPGYQEHVVEVEMESEQEKAYREIEDDLLKACRQALACGDKSLMGPMVQALLAYPDGCRRGETVYHPHKVNEKTGEPVVIATAPVIHADMLAKEEELLAIVRENRKEGRKVLVYLEHTDTRDLIPEVQARLENDGNRVLVLRSKTVSSEKREEWLFKKMEEEHYDVGLMNPRLVELGLDLVMFPTIVFFQAGHSTFTLRQASRRSWRIGQDHPVDVYYMVYRNTAQASALSLMADKIQTALAVEGNLSDAGLTAIAEGESSILIKIAKTLLGEEKAPDAAETFRKIGKMEQDYRKRLDTPEVVTWRFKDKSGNPMAIPMEKILRGSAEHKPEQNCAIADINGATFVFNNGSVLFGEKPVGEYYRNGTGYIVTRRIQQGQPVSVKRYIQLIPLAGNPEKFDLFELRPCQDQVERAVEKEAA